MSKSNTDIEPDDVLDFVPTTEESNQLADHLVATIDVLAEEIESGDTPEAGGMAGMMSPDMALSIIKPLARRWAAEHPQEVMAALARTNLETGALLDHHAPEKDPEDLLGA